SMGLGIVAYIVPFLFVYSPDLLIRAEGHVWSASFIITIILILPALLFLAAAVEGYIVQNIGVVKRIIAALIGIGLLLPTNTSPNWIIKITAVIVMVLFILNEYRLKQKLNPTKVVNQVL